MRASLVFLLAASVLLASAPSCQDTKKTRKCLRRLARKPRKCGKSKFVEKCRATCNACGHTDDNTGGQVVEIESACGCTLYRNGAGKWDTNACVKRSWEHVHGVGAMHTVCMKVQSDSNFTQPQARRRACLSPA